METLDYIKILPQDLKYIVYEFIDIQTRIELMCSIYNVQKFTDYLRAMPVDENIRLFKLFIQNQLFCKKVVGNYTRWSLKPGILKLLPTMNFSRPILGKKVYYNEIVGLITNISNIEYIPKNSRNYIIRNLEWKRREYMYTKNCQLYDVFSTLNGSNRRFIYIIKKTFLYYMIAIVLYGKRFYELQKIRKQHAIIKRWLKKVLPKPLKQSVREYNKRAKVRETERQKQMRFMARQKKKEANELKKIKAKKERQLEREKAKIEKLNLTGG